MLDRETVRARMAHLLNHPVEKLRDDMALQDLVTDSMILVNMVIELQEDLRVRLVQQDLKDVRSVGDLLGVFERK